MDTPLSMQVVCPICGGGNSLPGFLYQPEESVTCYRCEHPFRLGDAEVREIIRTSTHAPLPHLQDPDVKAQSA